MDVYSANPPYRQHLFIFRFIEYLMPQVIVETEGFVLGPDPLVQGLAAQPIGNQGIVSGHDQDGQFDLRHQFRHLIPVSVMADPSGIGPRKTNGSFS